MWKDGKPEVEQSCGSRRLSLRDKMSKCTLCSSSTGGRIGATTLSLKPLALDQFRKARNELEKVLPGTSEIPSPTSVSQLLLFKRSMNISYSWKHHYRMETSVIYLMFFFFFF